MEGRGKKKPTIKHKIVLLGDIAVGKTSIFQRFIEKDMSKDHNPTIGCWYNFINIEEKEYTKRIELWDTAGQERFHSLAALYYKNAQAALVVYDVTSKNSLTQAQRWIDELNEKANPNILIILAGNKIDLFEERVITEEQGKSFAEEYGLLFKEVSALKNTNIKELFDDIVERLPTKEMLEKAMDGMGGGTSGGQSLKTTEETDEDREGYLGSVWGSC
jgi:Ras-related protein Rab-5C